MTTRSEGDPGTRMGGGPRRGDAVAFGMAALVLGVVFAGITWLVVADPDGITPLDESVDAAIHQAAVANSWLVDLSLVLGTVGSGVTCAVVATAVVLALLAAGGWRRPWGVRTYAAVFLLLSSVGGAVINSLVKHAVDRPRPPWNGTWTFEDSSSYPSGHAQAGISVWVALALVALVVLPGRWRWPVALPLLALGPLIGMSRTVLGVHWPTDVLGGWTQGAMWMAASAAIVIVLAAGRAERDPEPVPSASEGPVD